MYLVEHLQKLRDGTGELSSSIRDERPLEYRSVEIVRSWIIILDTTIIVLIILSEVFILSPDPSDG